MIRKTLRPSPTALLNPKADPIFKILFTDHSKEARIALSEFLGAVLYTNVSNIKLLPNILSGETPEDRQTQFDLTCRLANNEYANIEMQGINHFNAYDSRAEYNAAHLLNHYVKRGYGWEDIPTAFQISVLNFEYNSNPDEYLPRYTMRTKDGESLAGKLNVIFMELPKFKKFRNCKPSDLTPVEKWGTFFVYADDPDSKDFIAALALEDFGIMNVMEVLSRISRSERNWYKQRNYWFNIANIKTMKDEARKTGLQEGREEGLQQGIQEGIEQGQTAVLEDLKKMTKEDFEQKYNISLKN